MKGPGWSLVYFEFNKKVMPETDTREHAVWQAC